MSVPEILGVKLRGNPAPWTQESDTGMKTRATTHADLMRECVDAERCIDKCVGRGDITVEEYERMFYSIGEVTDAVLEDMRDRLSIPQPLFDEFIERIQIERSTMMIGGKSYDNDSGVE